MKQNNISLPDFLLADLYKNCLVDLQDNSSDSQIVEISQSADDVGGPKNINFLGQNSRNVVILLKDAAAQHISDEDLQFLIKILKACQLNLSDIAIVNIHHQKVVFEQLKIQFAPAHVILFDIEPSLVQIPFSIPQFQVLDFAGCKFLVNPALADLRDEGAQSKVLKTQLWATLQKAFQLN